MQLFINDDQGYAAWYAANPGGYVLNVPRGPHDNQHVFLHQVPCGHLDRPMVNPTTKGYYKICSLDQDALDAWVATQSRACHRCPDCPSQQKAPGAK